MPTRPRPSPRQAAAALLVAGGLVGGAVALQSDGAGATSSAGPTATAVTRDLRVTDDEAGTLARADTTTVVYDGTGGRVGGGPAGSQVTAQAAGTATVAQLAGSPTQDCGLATPGPPSTDGSTSTTACPTTTAPEPPTTTTIEPPPPVLPPEDTQPPDDTLPPDDAAPQEEQRGPVVGAPTSPSPDGLVPEGSDTGSGPPSATLTELLPIGSQATRGSVLYRADDEPIVALLAATPLFRDLTTGVEGPDVAALEANLVELGYGSGLDVDEDFDAATAAAVREWEEDLGRADPDGIVTVGEVTFLDEPTAVLGHEAAVGDLLEPGDPVLVLGTESRVVESDIVAEDASDWPVGTTVTLDWGDGTTGTGTVTEVSRDVVGGEVAFVVTIAEGGGADRPVGSRVGVVRTVAERTGVLAVPVAAVVDGDDGPAVRVAGDGADRLALVELGIVDAGWVEVTSGIDEGTAVRLPG
jgi:hypothetical protein